MNKKQLEKQIFQKELQLKQLHLHPSTNELYNDLYNKLIMEKAILKKDLENLGKKHSVVDKLKKVFSPQKKLICDYWDK